MKTHVTLIPSPLAGNLNKMVCSPTNGVLTEEEGKGEGFVK